MPELFELPDIHIYVSPTSVLNVLRMFYRGGTLSPSESVILIPDADAPSDVLGLFELPEIHNYVCFISVLNVV